MTKTLKGPKTDYKMLVAIIIGAWFLYTLNTMPVYVQLNCTKYADNSGYCNLNTHKVIGIDKKNINLAEISGVELAKDNNNSKSSPNLYLKTSGDKIMLLPNFFMNRDEAVEYESQINSLIKNNGPANLKIQKDAIVLSIIALALIVGLIVYTFKDFFFPKKS